MTVNNFHRRLRDRRTELGLTQQQVADAIGKTKGSISHYEGGEVSPPDDIKAALARALHCTAGWLAFGERGDEFALAYTRMAGVVASGGRVVPVEGGEIVPVPPGFAGDKVLAYRVEDSILAPQIGPGDLIYTESQPMDDLEALIGQPAVVQLRTGVRILRVVEPSLVPGMVVLTAPNATALADVEPTAAFPVIAISKAIAARVRREHR